MRLPYVQNPPQNLSEEDAAVLQRVRTRRGEKGLIPLDLTLLHAPKVADGWNSHLGAIRTQTTLESNIRELAILRPALHNRAWFEWHSHLPLFQSSKSYTPSKLATISDRAPKTQGSLTDAEWVVLRYADAMTNTVSVERDLFNELNQIFNNKEVVEITATIATYNMVSRFLVALDVGEVNDVVVEDGEVPEWEVLDEIVRNSK